MRGKTNFNQFSLLLRKASSIPKRSFAQSFEKVKTIFPSLSSKAIESIKSCVLQKGINEMQSNKSALSQMLDQAENYFDSGKITASEDAIFIIMGLIEELNLHKANDTDLREILARAYYINGKIKACGTLEDRSEAEQSLTKAMSIADQTKDPTLKTQADNVLRSLELNRYKLREGESFDFNDPNKRTNGLD